MGPVPWTEVGLREQFRLLAGAVDGDGLLQRVDEPGDRDSVGDPFTHFACGAADGRSWTEPHDEFWTNGTESPPAARADGSFRRCQLTQAESAERTELSEA